MLLLVFLLGVCSANELAMRHFLRAMRRGELDEARLHLTAMKEELAVLQYARIGAPCIGRLLRELQLEETRAT